MKKLFNNVTPFEHFGLMIDNSRTAVMNVTSVKKMIDIMESLDYNMLMLYTEDTYEVKGQPYFGHLRGRYKQEELKEIDAYAKQHGIELIPCIQTLAHFNCLMYWEEYSSIADCDDILCIGEDKVYKLIEDIFDTLAECFTSRIVNIGMDEAFMVGLGKYLRKNGYRNRIEILCEHLNRVNEIAKKHGFQVWMWSDMFFRLAAGGYCTEGEVDTSVSKLIPDNVRLIYWDYHGEDEEHYDKWIMKHEQLKSGTIFAGGLWTWTGFVPHNKYAIQTGKASTKSCLKNNVQDMFHTIWGDNGAECSRFAAIPSIFYNACLAHGIEDESIIKEKFQGHFGISLDDYMLLDLPGTANDDVGCPDPDKYMLYCDCLLGKFDLNVKEEDGQRYGAAADRLAHLTGHSEFGLVFASMKALCEVLEIKFDIGVRTRNAYLAHDTEGLRKLLADYDEILRRIEVFYEAFRAQWLWENKPHGMDSHDTRIGGLIYRTKQCKRRIMDYLDGKLEYIEELEEPVLDFLCRGDSIAEEDKHGFLFNGWGAYVTASIM